MSDTTTEPTMSVRRASDGDAEAIAEIYNHYILGSTATFHTEPVTAEERRSWMATHDQRHPVLVAEIAGRVVAWGSLTRWSERPAYAPTVEVSTYVQPEFRGRGLGRLLMEVLVEEARLAGHHVLIGQIVAENEASISLARRMGFEQVGVLREVGYKFDRRLDVVFMERIL